LEDLLGTAGEARKQGHDIHRYAENVLSILLVLALSGFSLSLYLPFIRIQLFAHLSIFALLVWRYVLKSRPVGTIPLDVILFSSLFFFTLLASAIRSSNQPLAFYLFDNYKYFILGGLLFTAPLSANYRRIVVVVLFTCAAVDGLAGILQFYGILSNNSARPHGFAVLPTIYAARLVFIPATALMLLMINKAAAPLSRPWTAFLIVIAVLTAGGILLSGGRGTWIALASACTITFWFFNRKKALLFFLCFMILLGGALMYSGFLRERVVLTITSLRAVPDGQVLNATQSRFELWKGSLLIFEEHPLFGVGDGNFKNNIERLILEKKLREPDTNFHAHNIFFQLLATQGILGFVVFLGLLIALIRWGLREVRERGGAGGYIIILCTLLMIVGGLTDTVIGMPRYVPIFFLIVGLLGPYELRNQPVTAPTDSHQ